MSNPSYNLMIGDPVMGHESRLKGWTVVLTAIGLSHPKGPSPSKTS